MTLKTKVKVKVKAKVKRASETESDIEDEKGIITIEKTFFRRQQPIFIYYHMNLKIHSKI